MRPLPSGRGWLHGYVSVLPSSLGQNNDCTSAAFKGRLHGTDGHGLCGVSGEVRVSPQLFEQLPVEGGGLRLSSYLRIGGPWRKEGRYWGWRVTQSRSLSHTHTHHRHGAVSLIPLCPCSVSLIYAENRYSVSSVTCQDQVTCLPSRACENNDGRGQALKGGLHSANSNGLCVVFAVWRGTTQVLKHLPMEHGRLSFTCDLAHVRDWRCKERRCFHTNNKHVLWWRRVGWKN